jgi:nicotinamide-nucleotide amidase
MKLGILTIGDELTKGMIQDTNSSFICREVNSERWQVSAIMAVGDEEQTIEDGLAYLMAISDAVIVTGGLGPTADDKTTASIAQAFGLALYTDESVLAQIKKRFEMFRIKWTENNAKQAMFPEGAVPIHNPVGTAWGFSLKRDGKIVIVIPGVPLEVKKIFPESVIPLLRREFQEQVQFSFKKTIKLFGISEAKVDDVVSAADVNLPGIAIGFYPRFPENHLVITSQADDEVAAVENLKVVEQKIVAHLEKYIFGYDDETLEGVVASLLTEKDLTLAVAESCTGGLITDRLTNVPGSSAFLDRGVVTYSNTSKIDMLGVSAETLEQYGAVSEQTAVSMAEGVKMLANTDIGLAVTGIAGPMGGTEEKPVGTVFIAVSDGTDSVCRKFLFRWERRRVKKISSQWALEILRRFLVERS